jgi:hypothetical protein
LYLRFDEGTTFASEREEHRLFFPIERNSRDCGEPTFKEGDWLRDAPEGWFADLPEHADEPSELKKLQSRVVDDVFRGETERMYRHRALKLWSRAGEDHDAFKRRVAEVIQERIDERARDLHDRASTQLRKFEARKEKLQADMARYQTEASAQVTSEIVSAGETLFGMFFGGRKKSLTTAVSRRRQTQKAHGRVAETQRQIDALVEEFNALHEEMEGELMTIKREELGALDDIDEVEVGLEKNDISLDQFGIVWIPVTRPL